MLRRIKLKNMLLILLGISMFTTLAGAIFSILALVLLVLAILAKVIGAILIGYNAYHVFIQIKNDDEDEVSDED